MLSFLSPLWTICKSLKSALPLAIPLIDRTLGSFDSSVHISEEASNAATAVPWAIVYAIGIAGVLGWGMFFFILSVERLSDVVSSDQRRARLLHGYRLGLYPQQPDRATHGDDLL